MEYRIDGKVKTLGDFGKSTQHEFDEAVAALPGLIRNAREGDTEAGATANMLLWALANESFNTQSICRGTFNTLFQFGRKEGAK